VLLLLFIIVIASSSYLVSEMTCYMLIATLNMLNIVQLLWCLLH